MQTKEVVKIGQHGVIWKMLTVALVAFIVMLGGAGVSQAADGEAVNSSTYLGKGDPVMNRLAGDIKLKTSLSFLNYTSGDGLISFANSEYGILTTPEKREYMETALVSIQKSGLSTQRKSKAYNFVADQDGPVTGAIRQLKGDTSADFVTAGSWFKPFSGPISIFLGAATILIFLLLSFSFVFDLTYLVIPMFRAMMERSDGKYNRFVSNEAQSAIRESESAGANNYKGYLGVYFKRRAVSVLIISLCLMYLITGKIYDLVAYFIP